jgi:hypothetical protein
MRRFRLLLLGGLVVLAPLGYAAPTASACTPYNGGSCTPGACHLVAPDPSSGDLSPIECYY